MQVNTRESNVLLKKTNTECVCQFRNREMVGRASKVLDVRCSIEVRHSHITDLMTQWKSIN